MATPPKKQPSSAAECKNNAQTVTAASLKASANTDPECLKCAEEAELQAVILYPALGTPYVAPASEKKIRLFLIVEDKCVQHFGICGADAPYAWYYINTHLRIIPFKKASKTSADLKGKKLYSSLGAAKEGIKVWYKGCFGSETNNGEGLGWYNRLIDHKGYIVANIKSSARDLFVGGVLGGRPLKPAFPSQDQISNTTNNPLNHLFEIELDFTGLRVLPMAETMYTLAWMVTCVYKNEGKAFKGAISHWEHQDKLVYDFFHQMEEEKQHFANPFSFNLEELKPNVWPKQDEDEKSRLKPFHPLIFKSGLNQLDIGHITDIHVSSRQFALARADAAVLEGISDPVGPKLVNCLASCKALFDKFQSGPDKVDAVVITGDLLDFNRNLDPAIVKGKSPKDQWEYYNLAAKVDDQAFYPRGLDDMLIYSLVKRAYENNLSVFMTTGNHEAYDEPYGISPRVNSYAAKRSANPSTRAKTVPDALGAAKRHEPPRDLRLYDPNEASGVIDADWAPNALIKIRKANEGIPADHNLTIYEASLIYGPTFPQIMQSWNYMPDNYDWFFTLFTPLADFSIPYGDQLISGLEWGDSERMLEGRFIPDGLLPRSIDAIKPIQLDLLKNAITRGAKRHLLFSHFTVVNYGQNKPYSERDNWDIDKVSDDLTSGTFEKEREALLNWLQEGKITAHFSGHSHRSGGYKIEVKKGAIYGKNLHVEAHDPAKQPPDPNAQLWVSSCAGGIGIQNLCGELLGWNLMPPSASRFNAVTREVKTIAADTLNNNKPRFCVALDYLQSHKGKEVLIWKLRSSEKKFTMTVNHIQFAVPFIKGVTFYIWDPKANKNNGEFIDHPVKINKTPSNFQFNCTCRDLSDLEDELISADMAFVKVDFDNSLAGVLSPSTGVKLYDQYNFDDPWIFRVASDKTGNITYHASGEVPDWKWLWKQNPDKYPSLESITTERGSR